MASGVVIWGARAVVDGPAGPQNIWNLLPLVFFCTHCCWGPLTSMRLTNLVLQPQIIQAPFVVAFLGSGLVAPSPP